MKRFAVLFVGLCTILGAWLAVPGNGEVCGYPTQVADFLTDKVIDVWAFDISCPGSEDPGEWYDNEVCENDSEVICVLKNDDFDRINKSWDVTIPGGRTHKVFEENPNNTVYAAEGKSMMVLGAELGDIVIVSQEFDPKAVINATHLVFQMQIHPFPFEHPKDMSVTPTLFVFLGGTTIFTLPIHDNYLYQNHWTLFNVSIPTKRLQDLQGKVKLSFQFVQYEEVLMWIDTVRFARYGGDVPQYNHSLAEGECSPGCVKDNVKKGHLDPACDVVACDFASRLADFSKQLDFNVKTRRENFCLNQRAPGPISHFGRCLNHFDNTSCCSSYYDEEHSYFRDGGKLYEFCPKLADVDDGDCANELLHLRCALCHKSNSYFLLDDGNPVICKRYAKEVVSKCKKYCPAMESSSLEDFFSSVNFGIVDGMTRECFYGVDTGDFFLLDYEIALISVGSFLLFAIVVTVIVVVAIKGHIYAETVDDKYEPETCIVAPESTAPPTGAVELESTTSTTAATQTQVIDPSSLAQTQNMQRQQMQQMQMQQMMMMNSLAMAGGGLDSQAMMDPNGFNSQVGMNPALSQTQVPELSATVAPRQ